MGKPGAGRARVCPRVARLGGGWAVGWPGYGAPGAGLRGSRSASDVSADGPSKPAKQATSFTCFGWPVAGRRRRDHRHLVSDDPPGVALRIWA